ncbi:MULTISPECIES: GNAT family N-acetyltransferase [unclassified Brevibacterium]|uniref:GNAT family N-acetyltransferase n=1 Tax=unclassified Brevibacterium TaxID=2614124 RepID=UPI0010F757D8|nr:MULTISPECIES: GNAT family N-acetyltransferase [unclassified Brevibacterium]MCM1014151.1 GNAT family N-acetyltransferase [Brevibacterium sp. XM4083]
MTVEFQISPDLDDRKLSDLHHQAFGTESTAVFPWSARLERHSIFWVTAEVEQHLVGFVNVVGDGGAHAFILDTAVLPAYQGQGLGSKLIDMAVAEARDRGCEWMHVDFEPRLADFYLKANRFYPTQAGLLRLQ